MEEIKNKKEKMRTRGEKNIIEKTNILRRKKKYERK